MATRWGICSVGYVSHAFVSAVRALPDDHHKVVSVAARDLDRALEFAEKHLIGKAYGSYKELAEDPNIDVVYIATRTSLHHMHCLLFLNHGKSVLCENPMCSTLKQAKEVIELAREKGLFFLEGYWTRFFPSCEKLRDAVTKSSLGEVQLIDINISLNKWLAGCKTLPESVTDLKWSPGVLSVVGGYGIMLCSMIFGEKPTKIFASGIVSDGVDHGEVITLSYSGGRTGVIKNYMTLPIPQNVTAYGTSSFMQLGDIVWCPTTVRTPSETLELPTPEPVVKVPTDNAGGFCYEAEAVRQCLLKGELESSIMSHEHSLWNMEIMEEVRRQLGVHFPEDDM